MGHFDAHAALQLCIPSTAALLLCFVWVAAVTEDANDICTRSQQRPQLLNYTRAAIRPVHLLQLLCCVDWRGWQRHVWQLH